MALQIDRQLPQGVTASYHMITEMIFSRPGHYLQINFVGYKDHDFRTQNVTDDKIYELALYRDQLMISGDDFMSNVWPFYNSEYAGVFCYNMLKERIDYLKNSIDIM